jgi:hypothetical protein
VRLKGLIWKYNGLVKPNKLEKNAADELTKIYKETDTNKALIIDCKGILSIVDHTLGGLFQEINSLKRTTVFINFNSIEQEIANRKKEFCNDCKKDEGEDNLYCTLYYGDGKFLYDSSVADEIKANLLTKVENCTKKSFIKFESKTLKYLKSTPILTNGEFNASEIISNPESFYWTCLILADKVDHIIQEHKIGSLNGKIRLLSVSLRSSPFANIIGLLLGYYLETIDHFGPINKFFELDNLDNSGVEYIYIGDFTFGGTEIKISKNYAGWNNAKLEHAVVIGSLFDPEIYSSEIILHRIVSLKGKFGSIHKLFND